MIRLATRQWQFLDYRSSFFSGCKYIQLEVAPKMPFHKNLNIFYSLKVIPAYSIDFFHVAAPSWDLKCLVVWRSPKESCYIYRVKPLFFGGSQLILRAVHLFSHPPFQVPDWQGEKTGGCRGEGSLTCLACSCIVRVGTAAG